jgi:hypothetical protein
MNLLIYQAIYGEKQKGHSFLAASPGAPDICKEIRPFTDRPSYVPPGIVWTPYLSGYPHKQFYILSRTFPDTQVTRPGMVFTHCLLLPIEQAIQCNDLSIIISHLYKEPLKDSYLETLNIVVDNSEGSAEEYPNGFLNLLSQMLQREKSDLPVVWIGQEGFSESVTALWRYLWPEARQALSFRLSFDPQDTEQQQLTLVYTPEALASRWRNFTTVSASDSHKPETLTEKYILGAPEAKPLHDLIKELSIAPKSFSDLSRIERCHKYLESLKEGNMGCDAICSLARTIGSISPLPEHGERVKNLVIRELAQATVQGRANDVLALRNFQLQPYSSGEKVIGNAIATWITNAFTQVDGISHEELLGILAEAFSTSPPTKWSHAVHKGLSDAFEPWRDVTAKRVWSLWEFEPNFIRRLGEYIQPSAKVDKSLSLSTPRKLDATLGGMIVDYAFSSGMIRLYAAALCSTYEPEVTINKYLQVPSEKKFREGISIITKRVPNELILSSVLKLEDDRLIEVTGELCKSNPKLLSEFDPSSSVWRRIWLRAVQAGSPLWKGNKNPTDVVYSLLNLSPSSSSIEYELLKLIGHTPQANLLDHPDRSNMWTVLPQSIRKLYLTATATSWLDAFFSGDTIQGNVESVLEEEVVSEFVRRFDPTNQNCIQILVSFSERISRFKEWAFRSALEKWLDSKQPLKILDGKALGQLIARRRWDGTANLVFTVYRHGRREDLRPIIKESSSLLGWKTRVQLFLSGELEFTLSEDEWWEAFAEIAAYIYQWGPEDKEIWSRAGGEYHSVRSGNAKEKWHDALLELRQGGGGRKITVERLLKKMIEDYPKNDALKLIYESYYELFPR